MGMVSNYAIVADGKVVNVALAEQALGPNWIQSDTASVGDLWDGTSFTRPEPPEPSIEEVRAGMSAPRLACRLALIEVNKWSLIQPAIDAIMDATERETAQAFFDDARNWRRLDPFVQQIGTGALGYDDAGLDALFVRAQEIDASLG